MDGTPWVRRRTCAPILREQRSSVRAACDSQKPTGKKKARDDSDEMLRTSAVIGVARPVTLYSIPLSETVTYRHYPNTQWGAPVLRVYQFPRTRLSPVWNIYRSLRCMRSRSIEISCSDHSYLLVRPILCLGIDEQTGKDSVLHRLRKCGFLTQPKMFQHPR